MNISSTEENQISSTREYRKFLEIVKKLRKDVKILRKMNSEDRYYSELLKKIDVLEEYIKLRAREMTILERALTAATSIRLTHKQRILLRWLSEEYGNKTVYTTLIERISRELQIPRSTVRWNLKGLREGGLIKAGDKDSKGTLVKLTEMGSIMAEYISAKG